MTSNRLFTAFFSVLMSSLLSQTAWSESLVSQKTVSCKLSQGEFVLNFALTPDNIESNKTAIFEGSYLGAFDSLASGYSDPRPKEKLYESIYRRAYQLRDVASCLSMQGQTFNLPKLETAKIEFAVSESQESSPSPSDKKNGEDLDPRDVFKAEFERIEAHFKAARWIEGMDSLRALAQLLDTPLWNGRAGQEEIRSNLKTLRARYLPDGIASCHIGWDLALKSSREQQKGRTLRHFANRLCQEQGLPSAMDKLADIILLDALLPTQLEEWSEARLLLPDALFDSRKWQALMKGSLQTVLAKRILFASREGAPLLASEGLSEAEIIKVLLEKELSFYAFSQDQKDLIVSRFQLYAAEGVQ